MSRPITISIPKPCHENWQDMTATERGAFCKSCQKEVIDFTKKTEDETHRILSAGGATCGRFRTDQLERPIHQTTYIRSWWHWKAIAASVLSFVGYKEGMANPGARADIADIATAKRDTTHVTKDSIPGVIRPIAKPKTLSGKVVSNRGNKLGDATVELIDSNNVIRQTTTADWKGNFKFVLDSTSDMQYACIKAYTSSYRDSSIEVSLQQDTIPPVVLTLSQMYIKHEIDLEEITISSNTITTVQGTGMVFTTAKVKKRPGIRIQYFFYRLFNKQRLKKQMKKEELMDIDEDAWQDASDKKKSNLRKIFEGALRYKIRKDQTKEDKKTDSD